MSKQSDNLKELIKEWIRLDYIEPEDVPAIELYMDQVTTFMDKQLANTKRFDSDKTLTKTMINNYTKNDLLPPPIKKKYTKEHIYLLIYIYYFKTCMSISDIQTILDPMVTQFCDDQDTSKMDQIYQEIFAAEHAHFKTILESVDAAHNLSKTMFENETGAQKEYLHNFAFMALLSYDIYLKKKLMEKMIDHYLPDTTAKTKKSSTKDKSKDKKKITAKEASKATEAATKITSKKSKK